MNQEQLTLDRRRRHMKSLLFSFFMGRRRVPQKNQYVDVHEPVVFYMTIGIILLCAVDAVFTTIILSSGGTELNPIMDALIKRDLILFFTVKFLLTVFGVLILMVHKNFVLFRRFNGYQFLCACFLMYTALFCWEIYLLSNHSGDLL